MIAVRNMHILKHQFLGSPVQLGYLGRFCRPELTREMPSFELSGGLRAGPIFSSFVHASHRIWGASVSYFVGFTRVLKRCFHRRRRVALNQVQPTALTTAEGGGFNPEFEDSLLQSRRVAEKGE